MVDNCSTCGNKLDKNIKFCPECGEKVPLTKETNKKQTQTKKKVEAKTKKTQKKNKKLFTFKIPKISIKKIPKPMLAGITVLCVVAIAIAGVVVLSPFDLTGGVTSVASKGGRVIAVEVENTCGDDADCYITVSGLRYQYIGSNGEFTVPAHETMTISLVEDTFIVTKSNYEISVFANIDHLEKGTALDVTESAHFTICELEEEGEFSIS